jgi:hypothetical protein
MGGDAMIIYLDADFACHLTDDGTMRTVETDFFNGKCAAYIEGFRYVPAGETWTRPDGAVFGGEMISPTEDYNALLKAQGQYELDEAKRWGSLSIPQEQGMTASRNHVEGEFLSVHGKLYKCVYPIPATCTIVPGTNIVPATMQEYLESIKEG